MRPSAPGKQMPATSFSEMAMNTFTWSMTLLRNCLDRRASCRMGPLSNSGDMTMSLGSMSLNSTPLCRASYMTGIAVSMYLSVIRQTYSSASLNACSILWKTTMTSSTYVHGSSSPMRATNSRGSRVTSWVLK